MENKTLIKVLDVSRSHLKSRADGNNLNRFVRSLTTFFQNIPKLKNIDFLLKLRQVGCFSLYFSSFRWLNNRPEQVYNHRCSVYVQLRIPPHIRRPTWLGILCETNSGIVNTRQYKRLNL